MTQRLELNMYGLEKSIKRLEIAIKESNELDVYSSVSEVMMWVCNIDDLYSNNGDNNEYIASRNVDSRGSLINGVRYAFNSFKHNMDFVKIYKKSGGITFPISFPLVFESVKFNWTEADEKFKGYKSQKLKYKKLIEGKEILAVFNIIYDFYKDLKENEMRG